MPRPTRPYHVAGQRPLRADSTEVPAEAVARFLGRLEPAIGGCMTLRRLAVGRPRTSTRPKGYGYILWCDEDGNGHQIRAHRLALMLKLGAPIPAGRLACHRCDNEACCFGAHLYAGSPQDNVDDRERSRRARGQGVVPKLHPTRHHYPRRPAMACVEMRPG